MSKKSIRRTSRAIDARSHQTLRRSPRLLSSEREGKVSSLQSIGGEESVERHLGNLSKMSIKSEIQNRSGVAAQQNPLGRSPRFLPPEKLKPENSFQKSTFYSKSVQTHPESSSIASKSKEAASSRKIRAAICGKSQLKRSRSNSDVVLEETRNGPRRSPRLASEHGMKVSEIRQRFPDGNPRRQSMSLAPVSEENVKARIETSKTSDEVEHRKLLEVDCKVVATKHSMELLSVTTRAGKEWNEPEAITKSKPEIVPKKKSKPMGSQIRRSSPRLMTPSNAVMKPTATLGMTDKVEEVAERLKDNRGDLVLECRIEDGFVITKAGDLHKPKMRKLDDDNGVENRIEKLDNEGCRDTVAWTNEQEEALRKAFLIAKPSPHFWKKVSKMVPGKSAQECFDKIHSSIVTPLPPPPRPRTRKTSLSPIPPFNLSTNIFPHISENEAGRLRRCRTKKLAAQKTVRHLLRKHRLADLTKAADHFSLLESSPINIPVNVLNNISNFPLLSPQSGEKLSANSKMFSRFKLLCTPEMDPSPQVLKRIKNRDLHDRYIDQLHYREARRLMLAKNSKFADLAHHECVSKREHGALKAARMALISDAKSFISHFKHTVANSKDKLTTDCSSSDDDDDDDDEDIDVSDLDE